MRQSVLIAVLVVVSVVWAQPNPDTLWTRMYGGDDVDMAACIQQTSDSGYIIAGRYSFGNNNDCYLVKTDQFGNVMWTQSFGEGGTDKANSVQQTSDGGYIVACEKSWNYWLVKVDRNGDTLWSRTGPEGFAYDVQLDHDGGYVVLGSTNEFGALNDDFMLTKYNASDSLLWRQIYNNPGIDWGLAVSPTMDDGYIMVGRHFDMDPNESNGYVVKTDSIGNILWDYTFGVVGYGSASGVVETLEGDYVVAGTMTTSGVNSTQSIIIKLGAAGDTIWVRTLNALGINHAYDVRLTSDGGYIVTGMVSPLATVNLAYLLFKMNSDGDTLWTRVYNAHGLAYATSGLQTTDDGYVIAGYASVPHRYIDMYVVKTGPEGGSAVPLGANMGVPGNYVMHPVYPNPFNAMAVVKYEMPITGAVRVGVYDVLGRKVATLMDGQMGTGSHQVVWDAGEMPSGLYFVQMSARTPMGTAGDFQQVRKVVLLK